tara:strand:- start:1036 stop:1206 length:171 start_codon:yes stop_codon:yes gene_type:complete
MQRESSISKCIDNGTVAAINDHGFAAKDWAAAINDIPPSFHGRITVHHGKNRDYNE